MRGRLPDGRVRNTKDRDMPALEVRVEMPAAGFLAAPRERELKWPEELSGEQTAISLF